MSTCTHVIEQVIHLYQLITSVNKWLNKWLNLLINLTLLISLSPLAKSMLNQSRILQTLEIIRHIWDNHLQKALGNL